MNTINPQQLPQIRWQNQNVITTELLAQCYKSIDADPYEGVCECE